MSLLPLPTKTQWEIFLGKDLTSWDLEYIEDPRRELNWHATLKWVEGGICGGVTLGQLIGLWKAKRLKVNSLARATGWLGARWGRNFMYSSIMMSQPYTMYYFDIRKKYTPDELYERALRLRRNSYQTNVDRLALIGGIFGFIKLYPKNAPIMGFAFGAAGGIYLMISLNRVIYRWRCAQSGIKGETRHSYSVAGWKV